MAGDLEGVGEADHRARVEDFHMYGHLRGWVEGGAKGWAEGGVEERRRENVGIWWDEMR